MSLQRIDLAEEWWQRRRRQLWEARIWVGLLCTGLLTMIGSGGFLAWQLPQALQERQLWARRAIKARQLRQEAPTLPFPPTYLVFARLRCTEATLILEAVTRLLPREVWLEELQLATNEESGTTINLRGGAIGFEPIRLYADRLRRVGLFTDVIPLSVSRDETNPSQTRFEIRLSLPTGESEADLSVHAKEGSMP